MQSDQTFRRPYTVRLASVRHAPQFRLQFLVRKLNRRLRIDEVGGSQPTVRSNHRAKHCERVCCSSLTYIQFVEETGGVGEVEGLGAGRHREDVSGEEADGRRKPRLAQGGLRLVDAPGVQVDGDEGAVLADPLAEAFDPERRGSPGVEHVEIPDIPKQVELAVAEGDEILFELLPLPGRQGVLFV